MSVQKRTHTHTHTKQCTTEAKVQHKQLQELLNTSQKQYTLKLHIITQYKIIHRGWEQSNVIR